MAYDIKPLVSIIVPVYNMGDKIETCVNSLMKQTYRNIEMILVDDGSKDDSLQHCNNLAASDSRVTVIHTENKGSGPARNCGIEKSKGEFLYFPDADDYIEPEAIQIMVDNIIGTNADIVLCGYKNVDEKGNVLFEKKYTYAEVSGEDIRNNYAYYKIKAPEFGLGGAPWNKLFRKSVVIDNGVEYPPLRRHQDEAFIARFFCHCKKAVFIENVLYTYFTNSQEAEWKKYPTTYIDAVRGLYADRKNNVLTWNVDDVDIKEMVQNEYICNTIKALELSFSPKFNFDKKARKIWIKQQIENSGLILIVPPKSLGKYQKLVMKLIKKNNFVNLYLILKIKVFAEKYGIFRHRRKG